MGWSSYKIINDYDGMKDELSKISYWIRITFLVLSIFTSVILFMMKSFHRNLMRLHYGVPGLQQDRLVVLLQWRKLIGFHVILLRLFYFTGTSILQVFFLPGEFSGTFYGGILVIEFILKYLIIIYYSNLTYEKNMIDLNNSNISYLRLENDDFNDDTRLLNDID
ncbi:hypothetical protein I4U23_028316 [Adineta vaga]|nr:hypothetical protein I4U23_028316 [Adineta vaga]